MFDEQRAGVTWADTANIARWYYFRWRDRELP
jgi:hypothetical protein